MRTVLALSFALIAASVCGAERPSLFPRLHARLRPPPCVPATPCVPSFPCPVAPVPEPEPTPKVEASPKKYDHVTLRGTVVWPATRPVPPAEVFNVGPAAARNPFGRVVSNQLLIDPTNLGVKNVVVWLRPDDDVRIHTFPLHMVKPELRKPEAVTHTVKVVAGNYEPRVLALRVRDKLRFVNGTPAQTNLNLTSDIESVNILRAPGADWRSKPVEAQRLPVYFADDLHPWMAGRVRIFDHPYYAVTDKDGRFEIRDVPPGKWRVVYQHELGYHKGKEGLLGFTVEVKDDRKTLELDAVKIEFPTTQR